MSSELSALLRKPISRDDYRAVAVTGMLGVLFCAALASATAPRWEIAAVSAIFAIPGSLFGGVLYVVLERAKQQTPPQVTPTVYRQNALACLSGLLVVWLLIGGTTWLATGTSLSESARIAFVTLWGFLFLRFLAAWLYGRQARGPTLLDCGPHPSRRSYHVAAVISPLLALSNGVSIGSSATVFGLASSGILVLAGILALFLACGRLQVRENGVWQYWSLLRWRKIESYRWADDGTWSVKVRGLSWLRRGALPVPPEHKDAFDQLLQKQGVKDRARA